MKPNVVIITPDQMRADAVRHLGNEAAYTPYLDALAEEGFSFAHATCQNPVCVPSRCSFLTGLYPHTRGHRTMSYLLQPEEENLFSDTSFHPRVCRNSTVTRFVPKYQVRHCSQVSPIA